MDQPEPVAARREADRLWRWQRLLLPFSAGALALLALFFFASTFRQLDRLEKVTRLETGVELAAALKSLDDTAKALPPGEAAEARRWRVLVALEADVVRRRYGQVNATLQMRAWTRHMGFVTGMMMAFVGAVFILSKLSEARTEIGGEGQGVKASLATSSPGVVLAVLGTALMMATLVVNYNFETRDAPVYLGPTGMPAAPRTLPNPSKAPIEEGEGDDDRASPDRERRLLEGA